MNASVQANSGIARNRRFARLRVMEESEIGRPHRKMRATNIVQGQLDVRVDPLYDFAAVAINTPVVAVNLFTIAFGGNYTIQGGATITKTLYHTNSVQPNMLDAPKKLLVKNISLVPRPDMTIADTNALIGQTLLTFQTLGKEYWQVHGLKAPGGGGLHASGGAAFTAPQAQFGVSNGWPIAGNMSEITADVPDIPGYAPPPPITGVLLETNQPFGVSVDPTQTAATIYTTANSTTTVAGYVSIGWYYWVYLEGIKLVAVV